MKALLEFVVAAAAVACGCSRGMSYADAVQVYDVENREYQRLYSDFLAKDQLEFDWQCRVNAAKITGNSEDLQEAQLQHEASVQLKARAEKKYTDQLTRMVQAKIARDALQP